MTELDDLLIELEKRLGDKLTNEHRDALRKLAPETRMFRTALAMYDVTPMVLDNILRQVVEQAKKIPAQTETPMRAGGEKRMADATLPKAPISLEELVAMIPEARKRATTFEEAPTWEPKIGEAIVAKIKKTGTTQYGLWALAGEWAEFREGKLGTIQRNAMFLPAAATKRAEDQGVPLKEGGAYFIQFDGEKPGNYPNPWKAFIVMVVDPRLLK